MKHKKFTIFALLFAVSVIAMMAYAQDPTPTPSPQPIVSPTSGVDLSFLATSLADLYFWIALATTLVAGAVGGVVYELLILQGNIELPHKPIDEEITEEYPYAIGKYIYDLGIWARVIIGAMAAVAALLFLSPETSFELLATAVVAGSAGTSIFRSMQDRLSAAMAQRDVAAIRSIADKQNAKIDEAKEAFFEFKKKLEETSTSPEGERTLAFEAGRNVLNVEDLEKVEQLLNEARGIHAGI